MSRRVARPYAAALYQVLEPRGTAVLREVEAQLDAIAQLVAASPALLRVFEVPTVAPAKKKAILAEIGRTLQLRVEAQRALAALAQHYRLRFVGEVAAAFRDLIDRREGMLRGRVELPAAPRPEQLRELEKTLADALGKRVVLEGAQRPALVAGFVVRIGSRLFDGSLKTQLARFAGSAARRLE